MTVINKVKFSKIPDIFIEVNGMGFTFLLDTGCRHNLLTPCFNDFIIDLECLGKEPESKKFGLIYPPWNLYSNLKRMERRKVVCRDGLKRGIESVELYFDCDNKKYSEVFYIDPSLCNYCNKKNIISGVLGSDFMKKHKWSIDFMKMEINTTLQK